VIDTAITLPDGRSLAYTDCGAPAGPLVVYFHGAPTSRLDLAGLEESFSALGVRAVSPDRPGYGRSSPQAGRGFSDWAHDVAALADYLGVERFAVMGLSSGGPYAVACAALVPERIISAGVIAGVTDMGWPGAWKGFGQLEATLMRIGDEAAAVRWWEERYGPGGSKFFEDIGELRRRTWPCSKTRRWRPASSPPSPRLFIRVSAGSLRTSPCKAGRGRSIRP